MGILTQKRGILILLIVLAVSLPAVSKLFKPGFFSMYDDMQVIRVQQMDVCLKDGQIPCRWVPDLGYGYGYPLFQYYAPLPYYFMEGLHLLGIPFIDSVKAGFAFSIFFSAVFVYLLARRFFSKVASIVVTVLYIIAPFRAASVYVRGAMGEAWGLATLPLVLFGFEYFLRKRTLLSKVFFALTIFIFLISHNLTVIISAPLIIGWIILRLKEAEKPQKLAKGAVVSGILGAMLSSFYLLPLIFERSLVHLETLTRGYFNYISHFLSIKQLIGSLHWGYGPSLPGMTDDAFLGVGPIHAAVVFIALILLIIKKNKVKEKYFWAFIISVFLGSLFLAHPRSVIFWKNLSFMEYLQFPWRLMSIATFISAFLGGFVVTHLKKPVNLLAIILIIVLPLTFYSRYFTPKDWFDLTDDQKLSGELYERQVTASIYDYLPKSAEKAPDEHAPSELIVIDGEVIHNVTEKGSNWFNYEVEVISDNTNVSIPVYDFPEWSVTVDNSEIPYERKGVLGLVNFNLDKGSHIVKAKLSKTYSRSIGDTLSLAGLFIVLGVFIAKDKIKYVKTK